MNPTLEEDKKKKKTTSVSNDLRKGAEVYKSIKERVASVPIAQKTDAAKSKVTTKWYKGDKPTETEALAKIVKTAETDRATADQAYKFYEQAKAEGEWAETYDKATSPYLAALGIEDPSQINDEFFASNAHLYQQGIHTSTGALSSAKKNGPGAILAYNLSGLQEDYYNTKKLQAEQDQMVKEAQYWMSKGLDDDEIKAKLSIGGKYKNIESAIAKASVGEFTPTTAPIWAATSWGVDGMLWSLRNPEQSTGDYFHDAIQKDMGRGKAYVADPAAAAKRDRGSAAWAPYSNGTTMDAEAIRFGVTEFAPDWFEKNREAILASGDEEAIRAMGKVYQAEQVTQNAERQAQRFKEYFEDQLAIGASPDEIFADNLFDDEWKVLGALEEGRLTGKPVAVTRSIDFDIAAMKEQAAESYALKQAQQNAPTDPAAMQTAVEAEKQAQIDENGSLVNTDTVPKSMTAKITSVFSQPPEKTFKQGLLWASTRTMTDVLPQQVDYLQDVEAVPQSAPYQLAGAYSEWTDDQKWAAQNYISDSRGGHDTSDAIQEMKDAGLTDEQINTFRSQMTDALGSGDYTDELMDAWFEPVEAPPESYTYAEINTAIQSGNLPAALNMMEVNFDKKVAEDPELLNTENAAKASVAMLGLAAESGVLSDPEQQAQATAIADAVVASMGMAEDGGFYLWLDNVLNYNGALVEAAQNNPGWGLNNTLMWAMDHTADTVTDLANKFVGYTLNGIGRVVGSENLAQKGEDIANELTARVADHSDLLLQNGTPLEIIGGQGLSEIAKMTSFGKASQFLNAGTAIAFGEKFKWLTRMISSTPFALESGIREFDEAYGETEGNYLTSLLSGMAGFGATALMSRFDGILKNIEAQGMPFISEVVDSLSTVPGSGAKATIARWGKAGGMWLWNLVKTGVNEAVQEPSENIVTTFLTDLVKGENPLDRDWEAYGKELVADAAMAFLISTGSSVSTMPTYANSVKVAEAQMGKTDLTPQDVEQFITALQEDANNPQLQEEAAQRAQDITVEVKTGELAAQSGAPSADASKTDGTQKKVEKAQNAVEQATAELLKATQKALSANERVKENYADPQAAAEAKAAWQEKATADQRVEAAQQALAEAQEEATAAQAETQAQNDASMDALRSQAAAEVAKAGAEIKTNKAQPIASADEVSYNKAAGGGTFGTDERQSAGRDVQGGGRSSRRDRLDSRTAVDGKTSISKDGRTVAGVVSRGGSGYESFERAASGGLTGEDGSPLILYHGTGEDFEMIERRDQAEQANYYSSNGIYLTNSPTVANEYAFRGSTTGDQSIHPVAVNTQKVVYFDGDSFGQSPAYQNYVAKLIERYNRYADKEGFADKLSRALDREVSNGNIDEGVAQTIQDAFSLHGQIDVVGVLGTQWNFGIKEADDQYIVFDPSHLVPATEAYWADQEEKYAKMPKSTEPKPAAPDQTPTMLLGQASPAPKQGVSQFAAQTGQRTSVLSDSVKKQLAESPFYQKTTEKQNVDLAVRNIEHDGYETRRNKLLDGSLNLYTPEGQVEAYVLAKVAKDTGDAAGESAIAFKVKESGTLLGQSLAMRRMYIEMTPEGKAQFIQRIVDQINQNYANRKKSTRVEAPAWLAERLEQANGNDEQIAKVLDDAYAAIAEQMPPDWKSRMDAWRYTAMLANPRTHIRNFAGNLFFMPAVSVKNKIGALAELTVAKDQRTKSLAPVKQEYKDFAKQQLDAVTDVLTGGGKHNPMDEIQSKRRTFNSALLEWVSTKNGAALEAEDAFFLNRHFTNALAGFLQARGVDTKTVDKKTLQEGLDYAILEAQKATYRDASEIADKLSKFSKDLNNSQKRSARATGLVLEGALPFKKTPINVMRRGIEYSPVGLLSTLSVGFYDMKHGNITKADFIDRLASSMTGTGLAAIGAMLYSMGHLKLSLDEPEDELEKLNGAQEYSVELFGKSITIDWLSPSAMPLFVGGAIAKLFEKDSEGFSFKTVLDAMMNIAEPVFNLSMLDGVNSLLSSASYGENGVVGLVTNAAESYATQFIPSILGAFARILDPVRRTTYTEKDSGVPDSLQYVIDSTINKIPGLSKTGQTYLNAWGEEDVTDGVFRRFIENLVSPGYVNDLTNDDVETALMELFDATGNEKLLPKLPSKYFTVDGEKKNLTGDEYEQLTRERGQTARSLHEELFGNPDFLSMPAEYQVYAVEQVWEYATQKAKHGLAPNFKMDSWIQSSRDPAASIMERTQSKMKKDRADQMKNNLYTAVDAGELDTAATYVQGIIEGGTKRDSLRTSLTNHYKSQYQELYATGDVEGMRALEDALMSIDVGYKLGTIRKWILADEE